MKIKYLFFVLLAPIIVNSQVINFSDLNLKNKLLQADTNSRIAFDANYNRIQIDVNNNDEIEINEALLVYALNVSNSNINNLNGLEFFSNVFDLDCSYNNITSFNFTLFPNLLSFYGPYNLITALSLNNNNIIDSIELGYNDLTNLSVTNCNNLRYLGGSHNYLTTINILNLPALETLHFNNNQLSNSSLSNFTSLGHVSFDNNLLTNLTFNNCPNIKWVYCSNNLLTTLDLSNLSLLQRADCFDNDLTSLNLIGCTNLKYLYTSNNNLSSLDCSSCSSLDGLMCENNQLTYLNVKNGIHETSYGICGNPNLNYICVDNTPQEIDHMTLQAGSPWCGYSDVTIDPNCLSSANSFALKLFPNPTQNILNISTNSSILIKSITIYNNIGQLVQTQINDNKEDIFKLDVSLLSPGIYFTVIDSDKGLSTEKFLKN